MICLSKNLFSFFTNFNLCFQNKQIKISKFSNIKKNSKFIYCSLLFILISNIAFAQRINMGARAMGIGNTSTTLGDAWAVFNNIGALAWTEETYLLAAVDNKFTVSGLNTVAAGAVLPLWGNKTMLGSTISRFGDNLFNEVNFGIGISHKIEKVSLGIKANYVQFATEGLPTKTAFTFEFGGKMQFTKHLFVAAHIYNFNQAQIANFKNETLPIVMKAAISYRPLPTIILNFEGIKDIDYPSNFRAGAEYKPIKMLAMRAGISLNPLVYSYGTGVEIAGFTFDYALLTHTTLLPSHHLSIAYKFRKLRKS
jgi:hypothetical protein